MPRAPVLMECIQHVCCAWCCAKQNAPSRDHSYSLIFIAAGEETWRAFEFLCSVSLY
jgi:hypothetical protein